MWASITSDMFNYSFRPTMNSKLALFAGHGFEYIHWCDDWNNEILYSREDMERYRRLVDADGLRCLDVHGTVTDSIGMDASDDGARMAYIKLLKNRVEFCSVMGGDLVVVHPPRYEAPLLRERLERSIETLNAVRPLCKELGVVISFENCTRSDEKILETYFAEYPSEFVGFCFDSGHANINGNMEELFKFGDRLKALHLHDNMGKRDDHQPPFCGNVDWRRIMGWIKKCGYRKPLNFEVTLYQRLFKGSMVDFLDLTTESIERVMKLYQTG